MVEQIWQVLENRNSTQDATRSTSTAALPYPFVYRDGSCLHPISWCCSRGESLKRIRTSGENKR